MTPLVPTPEQTAIVESSDEPTRIIAANGGIVGWINPSGRPPKMSPFTAEEIAAAETAVQVAKRRLELGREPQPGERLGLAGGGTRLSPDYEARVAGLEREVAEAEARLAKSYAARNAAR